MPEYNCEWTFKSKSTVTAQELAAVPDTLQKIKQDYANNWLAQFAQKLLEETQTTVLTADITYSAVSTEDAGDGKLYILVFIHWNFTTDKPLHTMQEGAELAIPMWLRGTILLIIKVAGVIAIIAIAGWAITSVINALKDLTTLTTVSWLHDENVDSPNYCTWMEIIEEEPRFDWALILMLIVFLFIAMTVLPYVGRKKK